MSQRDRDLELIGRLEGLYSYFRVEEGRDDAVCAGEFYAHPQAVGALTNDLTPMMFQQQNLDDSRETRYEMIMGNRETFAGFYESLRTDHPAWDEFGWWDEYDVPGCVEEEGAPTVHVVVRRLKEKGPHPTIFHVPGGGLMGGDPFGFAPAPLSKYLNCQIVACGYRGTAEAEYPAAINDVHAAYAWMVAHAQELDVDLDRVVIYGMSSGGHLAACLPFRLRRFGWEGAPMPRGVVVDDGFFDDRETTHSMRTFSNNWSGLTNRACNMLYMGRNFASGFIGPEAYANHATVDECAGLPPYSIFAGQGCPGCDPAMQFAMKLNENNVFCNFFMSGGTNHAHADRGDGRMSPFLNIGGAEEYEPIVGIDMAALTEDFVVGAVRDFFDADLRRIDREGE